MPLEFYILNQNEVVTATLSTDSTGEHTPVYAASVDEKLKSYDILELSIPADVEHKQDIKEEYSIVFKDIKGWREYIINEIEDEDTGNIERTITSELSSIELLDEVLQTNVTGSNPTEILTNMLRGTRWTVGAVDPSIYNQRFSEDTEMVSVLEGIDILADHFNAEVSFSYAVAGNEITKRFVNLHKQIGDDNGKRFEVDKDVTSIKRTIDTTALKTAVIPVGKEPEEGEKRLDITNVVWSKANGDPADKPKGQNWLGDQEALAQWGKNNEDGSRRHRWFPQEIDVETESELISMAWVHLGRYTKPKNTYEVKALDLYTLTGDEDLKHEYVNLGDTVVVTDYYFAEPLVVQTRVVELRRDLIDPLNNDLVFGDSLQSFSVGSVVDRVNEVNKALSNKIELVRASADGKTNTYMGSQEPINPKEGDMWYRPHPNLPNEEQFLIWNGLTWDVVLDTSNLNEVSEEVKEALKELDKAKESANEAVEKADQAIKDAGFAKVDAGKAQEDAAKAISDANKAATEAGTALSTANTAKTNAGTALTTAQTSLTNSGTALEKAGQALSKATEAETETGKLSTSYNNLTQTVGLKADKTEVSTIKGTVTQHGLDITANAKAVGLKADKTVTDIINQTVAKHTLDIKATADGLAMKAEKALVDSLKGTVATHTSQIKATADGLGLKADKSLVDTVKGTVDTHTAQIKATSDGLALKAEKSLVDTINGTVNTHTSQIKATSDGLGLKADKTLVDTVKGTVDKHTTDIKANADGLKLKAEASAVNTLTGTVNTHTNQISANATAISARLTSAQVDSLVAGKNYVNQTTLNATANGLSSSITQVENTVKTKSDKVDAMSGGGKVFKNPLNDSKSQATITGALVIKTPITNNYMTKISISGYNWKGATSNVDLDVSFYAYQNNTFLEHSYVNKGNFPVGQVRLARDSAGRTVIIIGTGNSVWNYPKIQVTEAIIGYTTPPDSYQDGWGLEYVTSLSAYTAVIDVVNGTDYKAEIDTTVTKISTVEQTVNGIQATVANKADKSQITQLSSQISSKVESATYNSKMTQLDSAINLRVVAKDVTDAILSDKKIKDTRATNQLPSWYFANYPSQTVEEFKQRTTIGVSGSATYGQLTTKVIWSGTSGGVITQIFSSSDGVFQRQGNAGATAWLAWDKVAESGKLISQINLSTEGILLQGKRIQLDGDVTMTSAFINSIKAIDIAADRIKTGTLNAANVNIINLNASKIATGTMTGANYNLNLNSGAETFRNPSTGDSLTLNQGEIQFQNGAQGRYLKYQSEGLLLQPFAGNTGTSKNTALHLIGGGPGSYQYIQFVSQDKSGVNMRLEAEGQDLTAYHGKTGNLIVAKYGESSNSGSVISGAYETRHSTGVSLRIAGDSISTPRDGARNIYLTPQGTGSVVSGAANGTRYTFVASDFVKQSTRKSKTDIKPIETSGLSVIGRLLPVSYKKKDKIEQGIIETELGFIAEDSLEVATPDGEGIYDSHITAYLVKAVQELGEKIKQLEEEK